MSTGEAAFVSTGREFAEEQSAAEPARLPMGALQKSDNRRAKETDQLAAGKPSSFATRQDGGIAPPPPAQLKDEEPAPAERVIVTGSNIPTAEETGPNPV